MKVLIISPVSLISENECGISKILFNFLGETRFEKIGILSPDSKTDRQKKNFPKASFFFYKKSIHSLTNIVSGRPRSSFSKESLNQIVKYIDDLSVEYDQLHFFSYAMIPLIQQLSPAQKVKSVLSLIDSHPLFFTRRAQSESSLLKKYLYQWEARKYFKKEQQIPECIKIHFVSQIDCDYYNATHPDHHQNVISIENGVSLPSLKEVSEVSGSSYILFFGNLSYAPNIEALNFIVQKISPLIQQSHPSVKIVIAGKSNTRFTSLPSNVEHLGYVDDLFDLITRSRLTLFPLFFGTGIKNKVLEAFATGNAILATPVALEGIPLANLPKAYPLEIIDSKNPENWIKRMNDYLTGPIHRQIGYRPLTWESFGNRMTKFYQD